MRTEYHCNLVHWVYEPFRQYGQCVGPRGPCNACREWLDKAYNPRHVPVIPLEVDLAHDLVLVLSVSKTLKGNWKHVENFWRRT